MTYEPRLSLAAGVLAASGLGLFLYKALALDLPLVPAAESAVWAIEARITFTARGGPVKVVLRLPEDPPGFTLLDESFVSRGYGLATRIEDGQRVARWARRQAQGEESVYYRALVHPGGGGSPPPPPGQAAPPRLAEPERTALAAVVDEVRERSADDRSFTTEILQRLNDPAPGADLELLLRDADSADDRAELAVDLLAQAGIPARVVNGVLLGESERRAPVRAWLETWDGETWRYFDPGSGAEGLPEGFFLWWRGDGGLARVSGGEEVQAAISLQPSLADALEVAERRARLRGSRALEFSIAGLPLHTQAVYAVLLMVPIGAFVMVVLRNVVGVRTFGTFLPVLVALAFRETRLFWGLVLFSMLIAMGLVVRFALERLRLLLVPRLASVLTVVVLMMAAVSVLGHRLGLEIGLSVALFPMVILTITIEHMSIVWEERGPREAILQGLGTMAVAALAYVLINLRLLQHLVFLFPELLLVVLAAILLLGRYSGYRLLELGRFRAFREAPREGER